MPGFQSFGFRTLTAFRPPVVKEAPPGSSEPGPLRRERVVSEFQKGSRNVCVRKAGSKAYKA